MAYVNFSVPQGQFVMSGSTYLPAMGTKQLSLSSASHFAPAPPAASANAPSANANNAPRLPGRPISADRVPEDMEVENVGDRIRIIALQQATTASAIAAENRKQLMANIMANNAKILAAQEAERAGVSQPLIESRLPAQGELIVANNAGVLAAQETERTGISRPFTDSGLATPVHTPEFQMDSNYIPQPDNGVPTPEEFTPNFQMDQAYIPQLDSGFPTLEEFNSDFQMDQAYIPQFDSGFLTSEEFNSDFQMDTNYIPQPDMRLPTSEEPAPGFQMDQKQLYLLTFGGNVDLPEGCGRFFRWPTTWNGRQEYCSVIFNRINEGALVLSDEQMNEANAMFHYSSLDWPSVN